MYINVLLHCRPRSAFSCVDQNWPNDDRELCNSSSRNDSDFFLDFFDVSGSCWIDMIFIYFLMLTNSQIFLSKLS